MGLNFDQVTALMWSLTAFATILTVGRYAIRWKVRHRFYADDYAHLNALVWLYIMTAIIQTMFPSATLVVLGPKNVPPPPAAFVAFRKLQTAMNIAFYISQWSVKFSFLFFYRELFWVSDRFRKSWWIISIYVFLTFWAVFAGMLTLCGSAADISNTVQCNQHKHHQFNSRIYMTFMNLSTDFAVMILPLFMLPQLRIDISQKLGLAFIFMICFVTIGLELLRIIQSIHPGIMAAHVLYGVLTANLTVIISCIPTYRSLLGVRRTIRESRYAFWGSSSEQRRSKANSDRSEEDLYETRQTVGDSSNDAIDEEKGCDRSSKSTDPVLEALPKGVPADTRV